MMCDWNRQLVSKVILILLFAMMLPPLTKAATEVVTLVVPNLEQYSTQEKNWVESDRKWLNTLGSTLTQDDLPDPFTTSADSVTLLKNWVAKSAQPDSVQRLRPAASLLRERWLDRGYLSARVTGMDVITLVPGSPFHWQELDISGDDFVGRDHLLELWLPRAGQIYDRVEMERNIEMILLGVGESGYPFPRWVTRELILNEEQATVTLKGRLLPGYQGVIGPISSTLESQRSSHFLARATGLQHGKLFQHSDLQRAVDRLLSRDLYSHVGTPMVYLTSSVDTVGIHFPVTERKKVNRFQVVLGLSRKVEGEPSRISGEVDMQLPNMAGTGRKLGLGWRDDGANKSWFGLSYLEPMAFGTPLDMEFILDNEIQTDSYTRFRLDNRWGIPVVALWGIELGVGWDRSTFPVGDLINTSRLRGRGAVLHHRGDRSRSGWSGIFALETAYRSSQLRPEDEEGTVTNPQLGEAVTQRIITGDLSGEWWLGNTLSLFSRGSYRQQNGGSSEVPLSEQFLFGGAATLRGYREDEFHGSQAAWGALEMRIGRAGASRLYTFYDLGYFEFSASDPLLDNPDHRSLQKGWPKGYGLGILARTPGGDISLAVGFPGTVDFDQAKLHVTLLESF